MTPRLSEPPAMGSPAVPNPPRPTESTRPPMVAEPTPTPPPGPTPSPTPQPPPPLDTVTDTVCDRLGVCVGEGQIND